MSANVRAYTLRAEKDGEAVVVAQIEIRCPECGEEPLVYVIPGHHLRTVRDVLIDILDQQPDVVDAGVQLQKTQRATFTVPGDAPKKSEMN